MKQRMYIKNYRMVLEKDSLTELYIDLESDDKTIRKMFYTSISNEAIDMFNDIYNMLTEEYVWMYDDWISPINDDDYFLNGVFIYKGGELK